MKYRLEAAKAPSASWSWFVRLAKKQGGYMIRPDGIHVVETDDPEEILAFWNIVRPWKRIAVYVDGRLISPTRFGVVLAQPGRTRRMLDAIIKKKADERGS